MSVWDARQIVVVVQQSSEENDGEETPELAAQ